MARPLKPVPLRQVHLLSDRLRTNVPGATQNRTRPSAVSPQFAQVEKSVNRSNVECHGIEFWSRPGERSRKLEISQSRCWEFGASQLSEIKVYQIRPAQATHSSRLSSRSS